MRAETAPSVRKPLSRSFPSGSGISPESHSKRTTLRSPSSGVASCVTRLPSVQVTTWAVSTTSSPRRASIQSSSDSISSAVW